MIQDKVTILISAHNSVTTIKNALDSLLNINLNLVEEIIYIDDNSTDGSREYVEVYSQIIKLPLKVVFNKIPQGLAKNFNFGIENSKTRYLITMHQDMEIIDPKAIEKFIELLKDEKTVLVYSDVLHPRYLLDKYNFWMRVNFSRVIDRPMNFSAGKFDGIDLKKINIKFNDTIFKHSGEDAGFNIEIKKLGFKIALSDIEVIHNHNFNANYSFLNYLKKESQLNETYGVLVRHYGFRSFTLKGNILMFHRLLLLICLFIPILNIFSFFTLIMYSFYYSKEIFFLEPKNPKIFIVPFANLIILSSGAIWNIIGYIKGKQSL